MSSAPSSSDAPAEKGENSNFCRSIQPQKTIHHHISSLHHLRLSLGAIRPILSSCPATLRACPPPPQNQPIENIKMKTSLLLLLLAVIPASVCQAAPQISAENKQRILEKFDTDGDGKLNDSERAALKSAIKEKRAQSGNKLTPKQKQRVLKKFDKDGDGKLNDSERAALKSALQARRAQRS